VDFHATYMYRCLQLALNGRGTTAPNPMVGAVIVHEGKIIGEGWHRKAGEPHAEVVAVESVKDKSLLKESTLYVNLEPCAFHGRTPACSTMIIREGIPRVVVAVTDPHPKVSGKGIDMLRRAGVEVITGVLEKESRELNRIFFTNQTRQRPYVVLKWARTADGFLAGPGGEPVTITSVWSRQLVHKWRSELGAILVGRRTLENDNPRLDSRLWDGRKPVPVVLGSHLSRANYLLARLHARVFVWPGPEDEVAPPFEKIEGESLEDMLRELYRKGITALLVEGGTRTLETFLAEDLWDEARIFTSPRRLGEGLPAPTEPRGRWIRTETVGGDKLDYLVHPRNLFVHEGIYL